MSFNPEVQAGVSVDPIEGTSLILTVVKKSL